MKKILSMLLCIMLILSCFTIAASAVPGDPTGTLVTLGGSNDDSFTSVAATSDGGFVAVGYTFSNDADFLGEDLNASFETAIIAKYDADGTEAWKTTYAKSKADVFNSVAVDSEGNIIAVGFSTEVDNTENAIVVKYDADGTVLWEKTLGGSDDDSFKSVAVDSDDNVIVAGEFLSDDGDFADLCTSKTAGTSDIIIAKYAADDGALTWKAAAADPDDVDDFVSGMKVDNKDGIVIVGSTDSDTTIPFIQKFVPDEDDDVVVAWKKTDADCLYTSIDIFPEGGYLVASLAYSDDLGKDAVSAVKYNTAGVKCDTRSELSSIDTTAGHAVNITALQGGNFIISAATSGADFVAKSFVSYFDSLDLLWTKDFAGSAFFNSTAILTDGNIALAGRSDIGDLSIGSQSKGQDDAFILTLEGEKEIKKFAVMKIANPNAVVNGFVESIDSGNVLAPVFKGTSPTITMLPIRFTLETLGADVEWDDDNHKIFIRKDDIEVELKVGSTEMITRKQGEAPVSSTLSFAPFFEQARTMIPLRSVFEEFGFDVQWDDDNHIIVACNTTMTTEELEAQIDLGVEKLI